MRARIVGLGCALAALVGAGQAAPVDGQAPGPAGLESLYSGLINHSSCSSRHRQPSHPRVSSRYAAGEAHEKLQQEFGMRQLLKKFFNDESGATAIEYCIIAAGLSIVIVTVVGNLGSAVNTKFVTVSTSLK